MANGLIGKLRLRCVYLLYLSSFRRSYLNGYIAQDATDTATVLQLRDTLDLISESLEKITSDLCVICDKYKSTPMAARSNLQQAVPISFGFKMARLLSTFERHQFVLIKPALVVEFGGAAGTLATINDGLGLQCQAELATLLDLKVPEIAWHIELQE